MTIDADEITQLLATLAAHRDNLRKVLGDRYERSIEPYRVEFRKMRTRGMNPLEAAADAMDALRGRPAGIAAICSALLDTYEENAKAQLSVERN